MDQALNTFLPDASAPASLIAGSGINHPGDHVIVTQDDIKRMIKPRAPFTHKGTYGHALLIAGTENTMGAALLCAEACLHGGAGLTTVSIPESGLTALNASMPEVMYLSRTALDDIKANEKYNSIAIGPGLGTSEEAKALLTKILNLNVPLVIDADALNILAKTPALMDRLPKNSILTPHLKEFDHLFGEHKTWNERLITACNQAIDKQMIIILKNQNTFIIDQSGRVLINPTGNPGMAQGGMGDVLTGLLAAYAAQKYNQNEAAILSCFLHGKSGDELYELSFNVTASQVVAHVPKTLKELLR